MDNRKALYFYRISDRDAQALYQTVEIYAFDDELALAAASSLFLSDPREPTTAVIMNEDSQEIGSLELVKGADKIVVKRLRSRL